MIVSHDGKLVWVTTETPQAVLELDSATGKILHVWNTTQVRSHMIVTTPNEMKFYVTNTVSGSVSVIDKSTGEVKLLSSGRARKGSLFRRTGKKFGRPAASTEKFRSSQRPGHDRGIIFQPGQKSQAHGVHARRIAGLGDQFRQQSNDGL